MQDGIEERQVQHDGGEGPLRPLHDFGQGQQFVIIIAVELIGVVEKIAFCLIQTSCFDQKGRIDRGPGRFPRIALFSPATTVSR